MKQVPNEVVVEDKRLQGAERSTAEDLAKLRWHWTLDETNPDRVSMREYARQVGVHHSAVHRHAQAYVILVDQQVDNVNEAVQRARLSTESQACAEAVAKAEDITFAHAVQTRSKEIRKVREQARERAEEHGTSVEEEAPTIAKVQAEMKAAAKKAKEEAEAKKEAETANLDREWIKVEARLGVAHVALLDAVKLAEKVEWGDEERELLGFSLDEIKGVMRVLDLVLTGEVEVDWDDELRKMDAA